MSSEEKMKRKTTKKAFIEDLSDDEEEEKSIKELFLKIKRRKEKKTRPAEKARIKYFTDDEEEEKVHSPHGFTSASVSAYPSDQFFYSTPDIEWQKHWCKKLGLTWICASTPQNQLVSFNLNKFSRPTWSCTVKRDGHCFFAACPTYFVGLRNSTIL